MKTIKVRPVLVESKEITDLLINTLNNRLLLGVQNIIKEHAKCYELILISLENEKIGEGDWKYNPKLNEIWQHNRKNKGLSEELQNTTSNETVKVIARQSQIPPEYIQQFIEEYNGNSVKDIEIEMEEYDHDEEWSEISGAYETYRYKPKLTNGFITIIDNKDDSDKEIIDYVFNKPILYTEEEMLTSHHALLQAMKFNDNYSHLFINKWFEINKKK